MVITPLDLSIWYTRVADPVVVLTSTVAGIVPPATVMVNALLTIPVATVPSGTGAGSRMVHGTDPPAVLGGSPHRAADWPEVFTEPTVPPKFTPPLVAATKSETALAPVSASVG